MLLACGGKINGPFSLPSQSTFVRCSGIRLTALQGWVSTTECRGSTGAQLFGQNIIDSGGELYHQFRKVIKPGITRCHDFTSLIRKSSELAVRMLQVQATMTNDAGVPVSELVFDWSVSVYGEYFLDVEFDPLNFSESNIQAILGAQNKSVIGRLKAMFPFLDKLPWTWDITRQTRKRFNELESMLMEHANRRTGKLLLPSCGDKLIHHMNNARHQGKMSDFHYRSNMKQLFVAGAKNVESVIISAMLELAKNKELQYELHYELAHALSPQYPDKDLNKLPLLSAAIYETLRLYPPLAVLRNRCTKEAYDLGGNLLLPARILIGRNVYGLHIDPSIWRDATIFDPSRWGKDIHTVNSTFRREQANGKFLPFGLYSRRCLGSLFAVIQLRIALCELILALEWTLPAGYKFSFSNVCTTRYTLIVLC